MRAFACLNCGQLVFFENDACLNCGTELGFDWPDARAADAVRGRARGARTPSSRPATGSSTSRASSASQLRAHPHAPGRRRRARPGRLRGGRGRQAPAAVRARRARAADRPRRDGDSAAGLRPALQRLRAGDHRPRRRRHHPRPRRVRRRPPRGGARAAGRALPDRARPPAPRDRPLLLAVLVARRRPALDAFRELFGDERADYAAALERHYADGPPPDWAEPT